LFVFSLSRFLSVACACRKQSSLAGVQMLCQQCGKRAVRQACATAVEGGQRLCLHIFTLMQWAQEICLWWQHLVVATVATLEPAAAVVAVVHLVVVLVVVVGLGAAAVVVGVLEGAAVVVGVVAVAVAAVAASFCDTRVLYVKPLLHEIFSCVLICVQFALSWYSGAAFSHLLTLLCRVLMV